MNSPLPLLVVDQQALDLPPKPPEPAMNGAPVNILLVDDEARNLDALESILESPDYCLVRANDADEALAALMAKDFAAIVLDVRMPTMSGLELAELIKRRKKTQHIPIIFLTAYYQEDEHVMRGYGAGAVDYLNKPCPPAILRSKVAVFVDLYRKSRELNAEIEERCQAERRITELNDQLARRVTDLGEANAELEAFTYSVSHDLRAPLRQVDGFVHLLAKLTANKLEPAAADDIPLIQDSVRRMGRLIDDLLAFSRVGRGELQHTEVNLLQLLDQVRQTLSPASEGRTIDWKIGHLPRVRGDSAMLRQVLASLIDNALKFTRLRARAVIEIGSSVSQPDEQVFFVRDNGVGFDASYADKLFGVFQRLHPAAEFEGNGIGLASVRRIITRHGGRTWAEGAPDQGATIYFSLRRSLAIKPQ